MTESHASQQQIAGLATEGEIHVAAHVRRRKPAGEKAPRIKGKPYPSKWGRGRTYAFAEARLLLSYRDIPWVRRLKIALLVLIGGTVRHDGGVAVLAPKGAGNPGINPTWRIADNDSDAAAYLLGE